MSRNKGNSTDKPGRLRLFASCPLGLEELLGTELGELGATAVHPGRGGVHFRGNWQLACRCCLWSRLASRVLWQLGELPAADADTLYGGVSDLPWENYLSTEMTFAVDFIGQSEAFRNSLFGARRVKDAIVDRLRALVGQRPNVDPANPDLRIVARLHRGRLSIGLDLAGSPLHQRGYRPRGAPAPIKETLAAALLMRANWPQLAAAGGGLYDPVCGSATLLIEGAMMAADMAPGAARRFACESWPGQQPAVWQTLREEAAARMDAGLQRLPVIAGADHDQRAIEQAVDCIGRAGFEGRIRVSCQSVAQSIIATSPQPDTGLYIANPPYGERLGETSALGELYSELGKLWRQRYGNWRVALFSSDPALLRAAGLPRGREYRLRNGALDCRLRVAEAGKARNTTTATTDGAARPAPVAPPVAVSEMLANRLNKNRKRLRRWLSRAGTDCYRLYDADMPEYAVAIDVYGDWVQISEYAPPSSVDPARAAARFAEVQATVPAVLEVLPRQVVCKRRERQRGTSQYHALDQRSRFLEVSEEPARLLVNLHDYLDTGLFLDHRPVRRRLTELARGRRFLNLFCYTAVATVQAALGGAESSLSVDMSPRYLDWARQNLELNQLDAGRHQLLRADCLEWLQQHRQRYGLIFLDPPTFSNSKRMQSTLDVQRDHVELLQQCAALLEADGVLFFSTNRRRFRLDSEALDGLQIEDVSDASWDADFTRTRIVHHCFEIRRR